MADQEYMPMPVYIALLRGINVSGQKKIRMADLKVLFEETGHLQVTTYIQSGNVVFLNDTRDVALLEKGISDKIKEKYGFEVSVMVKTLAELQEALEQNPFRKDPEKNPDRFYFTFLNCEPDKDQAKGLDQYDYSPEEYILSGQLIYFYSPHGYGKAKMNNNFFEQKLKVKATTRNLKTVRALIEISQKNYN